MESKFQPLVTELIANHGFRSVYGTKGYYEISNDKGIFVAILEYEDKPARIISGPCKSTCPATVWTEGEPIDVEAIVNKIRRLGDVK